MIASQLLRQNRNKLFTFCWCRKISDGEASGTDEFRVLELFPSMKLIEKKNVRQKRSDMQLAQPREKRMPIDQDWPSVWPAAKTFRPSAVPLPVYQGYDQKRAPPGKYANVELMKIPNFLHLTPPAIKRHCQAIKKFCTEWPKSLSTEEQCYKHFPIEVIYSDYCHSSPTIRDERSGIVTLKIKLNDLKLDYHGRDKLIRLVGDRYNKHSDWLSLVADRCPTRKQNYDYLVYLLTALHHESSVTEKWEHEKTEADMERFFYEGSRMKNKMIKTIERITTEEASHEKSSSSENVELYGKALEELINEKENSQTIAVYKDSVLKSFNLNS